MSARTLDAMIVGVEKAGTTSLLRYLSQHPDIASHSEMEFPYFVKEELYQKGWDNAFSQYFPQNVRADVLLGKSVGCIYWSEAALRLFNHNPAIKLIVVLRNPVDRAYSAYWYAVQMGREDTDTFERAIELESERLGTGDDFDLRYHAYLHRGHYADQLEGLLRYFPLRQIAIVIFEEFNKQPETSIKDIFEFLGVAVVPVELTTTHNKTLGGRGVFTLSGRGWVGSISRQLASVLPKELRERVKNRLRSVGRKQIRIPAMSEVTRRRMEGYFETQTRRLEQLMGREIHIWRE